MRWTPRRRRLAEKPTSRSAGRLFSPLRIPKSTVSLIVVHTFLPQVYGTSLLVIGLNVFAITAYLALAVLAAREHPR